MWSCLCLLIVFNLVDTKLKGFELSFKTFRNPALPYLQRYSWQQRNTPNKFNLVRTVSDDIDDTQADTNILRETTTEISVTLGNVFNSQKNDHISDYIEYLTRIKKHRLGNSVHKNVENMMTKHKYANFNVSDSIFKQPYSNTYSDEFTTLIVELTKHKARKRLSRKSEDYIGDIDNNNIDETKSTRNSNEKQFKKLNESKFYKETDNQLNESVDYHKTTINEPSESDKYKETNKKPNTSVNNNKDTSENQNENDNYNEVINTKLESDQYYNGSDKKLEESDKYLKMSDKALNDSYEEMGKTVTFPIGSHRYLEESEKQLKYSDKYLKEIVKSIKETIKDLKSAKDVHERNEELDANSKKQNIFSGEVLARLLASIKKNKSYLGNNMISRSIIPDINRNTSLTDTQNYKNITKNHKKAVKFVIPKADLRNADAVFIVFRNVTNRNISFINDYDTTIDAENTYTRTKKIMSRPEKRRKITKLMLDGAIPDWLGTRLKQFNKKILKLSDVQRGFGNKTYLPLYRFKRSLNNENKQMNTSTKKQRIPSKCKTNQTVKIIQASELSKQNKTRAIRSSEFGRKYRSPNKFRIIVRPTKKDNKLGQISVYVYREYKPFNDEADSLKKYFGTLLPTRDKNDTSQVKNKKNESLVKRNDNKLEEIEPNILSYLGLNTKSTGSSAVNNSIRNSSDSRKLRKHGSDEITNKHEPEKITRNLVTDNITNKHITDDVTNKNVLEDIANKYLLDESNQIEYKKDGKLKQKPAEKNDENIDKFANETLTLLNEYDEAQSIDPLTKQLSMLFPRPRRLARNSNYGSDTLADRNSILIFTKKLLRNSKSYKRNAYLSPHIDHQTYIDYMNNDFLSSLSNKKNSNKRNKTTSSKKLNQTHIKNNAEHVGFDMKVHNNQTIKGNISFYTKIGNSLLDTKNNKINKNMFGVRKPHLRIGHRIGPVRSRVKISLNTTANEIKIKPKAMSKQNRTSNMFFKPKENVPKTKERRGEIFNTSIKNNSNPSRSHGSKEEEIKITVDKKINNETELAEPDNKIKRSKKRELGTSGVFSGFLSDLNEEQNHEEMFNVDIGLVSQGDVFEQLESNDEYDPELYSHGANNTESLLHRHNEQLKKTMQRKQRAFNTHKREHKEAIWLNLKLKPTPTPKKVTKPSKLKHGPSKVKTTVSSKDVTNEPNINLYGYENLSTARKLYSDLDPVSSEDNSISHAEKHKFNRALSSMHLHPQLDDYNDEFLRDSNVDSSRIGVDYVNYNYLGPGIDFPDYTQTKYDKYANFLIDFPSLADSMESSQDKYKKPPNFDLPKVHNWQKDDYFYTAHKQKKPETAKITKVEEKPKRLLPNIDRNFDYMILDEKDGKVITNNKVITGNKVITDTKVLSDNSVKTENAADKSPKISATMPTKLPVPSDVIKQLYKQNEMKKQIVKTQETSKSRKHNVRKDKIENNNQTLPKVHIHVEHTTEFVAKEILFKDVNVYVHKRKPLRKQNNLHNSRHLLGIWSENHEMPAGNSIVLGVSPLDIWSHKTFHQPQPRPTPLDDVYQSEEEEFNRRKRSINKRQRVRARSRLVCCVVKRPDQQDRVKHVKATWGRRCDVIVFITSKGSEKHVMWEYTKAGLRFVYELHYKDTDWILKADIDSYIVVENLKYMVKEYDPETPLYFGRLGLTDFSNFVLSKEALQNLITRSQDSETCQGSSNEGIGYCLEYLGIKAVDSRDKLGRARFYPFSPFDYVPDYKHTPDEGLNIWSDYAVAFANVKNYKDMYTLDYFIYRIQPLATSKEILHKVSNINFTNLKSENDSGFTRPPHDKLRLTQNMLHHFKYDRNNNNNQSKKVNLDEFQDKMRQLNGLF